MPEELSESLSKAAQTLLDDVVLRPYAGQCLDQEYGGYLVDFDHQMHPGGPHRKSLEHAGRTTLAFVMLHRFRPDAGFDRHALHGFEFLMNQMWDAEESGFYALVKRDGTPDWEGIKHSHGVTYVARAFALSADILGQQVAADWVAKCIGWLDDCAWVPKFGGYVGTFDRNNRPLAVGSKAPTDHGDDPIGAPVGMLEINTQSDALGTMVDLLSEMGTAAPTGSIDRLSELFDRIIQVIQPNGVLPFLLLPDWTPTPTAGRLGHQFQTVRRLIEAGDLIDRETVAAEASHRLLDHALTRCRHPDGGFPGEVSAVGRIWSAIGSPADQRQCWVQLEALDALGVLSEHRQTDAAVARRYHAERQDLCGFIESRLADRRHGGLVEFVGDAVPGRTQTRWPLRRRRATLEAEPGAKYHRWKDISHETATLSYAAGARLAGAHPAWQRSE